MTMLNRLPTKDRLKSWGLEVDGSCVLCKSVEETKDHMFYGCIFSQQLWKEVLLLCGLTKEVFGWCGEVQWEIQKPKGKCLI